MTQPRQVLSMKQLPAYVGFSRSYIYKLIAKNEFPPPRRVGKRRVVWFADEIAQWQERGLDRVKQDG